MAVCQLLLVCSVDGAQAVTSPSSFIIAMLRLLMCSFQQHGFVCLLLGLQSAVQEEEDSGGL